MSLFDGSNCGLRLKGKPVFSVQYHPEASPGPEDSHYLFTRFVNLMREQKGLPAKPEGDNRHRSFRTGTLARFASMNEIPRQPRVRPTTQAAEGVPRLRWTWPSSSDWQSSAFHGRGQDRAHGGAGSDVAKGQRHEIVARAHNWLRRNCRMHRLPCRAWLARGRRNYCEPDFLLGKKGFSPTSTRPGYRPVSRSRFELRFDTTVKANTYAALGARVLGRQCTDLGHARPSRSVRLRLRSAVMCAKPLVPLLLPSSPEAR